jgi:hypothetical protein
MERFLERLTGPEVAEAIERGVDAVLLPIGTTEQHGPHVLREVVDRRLQFFGFPLRLETAYGSPVRAVGIVED